MEPFVFYIGEPGKQIQVSLIDNEDGTIKWTFSVVQDEGFIADLRGIFFDWKAADGTETGAPAGLQISDIEVLEGRTSNTYDASVTYGEDDVINLGQGNNMSGTGYTFDIGMAVSDAGIGKKGDDVQSVTFLMTAQDGLTMNDIQNLTLGLRLTSVGTEGVDGPRGDSLKLVEAVPDLPVQPEDPGATDPGAGDPVAGDPGGTTDPIAADPGTGEPPATEDPGGTTDPIAADPGAGDPVAGDPGGTTDPIATDPGAGDPVAGDPVAGDPVAGDPVTSDPIAADPGTSNPVAGDPIGGDASIGDAVILDFDTDLTSEIGNTSMMQESNLIEPEELLDMNEGELDDLFQASVDNGGEAMLESDQQAISEGVTNSEPVVIRNATMDDMSAITTLAVTATQEAAVADDPTIVVA